MADKSALHTEHQAQLSKLFDEALIRVLKETKDKISDMDVLLDKWPSFEQDFLERIEQKRADVIGSVSGYERHSRLRVLLHSRLTTLLATDAPYHEFTEPLRIRQQEREQAHKFALQKMFLEARQLVTDIELMRLAAMQGNLVSPRERTAIRRMQERAPADAHFIRYWRGADVILRERLAGSPYDRSGDTIVETPHAGALNCVFRRLCDGGGGLVNYLNKYEFYGRTAESVNLLLERNPDAGESEVLLAALDGALAVLKKWDDRGEFREGAELQGQTRLFPL